MRCFIESLSVVSKAIFPYHANKFSLVIDSPDLAAIFLRKNWDKELIKSQEQFYVIFLDEENIPIDYKCLQTGGIGSMNIDLRVLFRHAVLSNCCSIIVAHNHPNGSLKPSSFDKKTTQTIVELCTLHGFRLNDHIIITDKSYFSFVEGGLL
jgi:DNA repair protein RadC